MGNPFKTLHVANDGSISFATMKYLSTYNLVKSNFSFTGRRTQEYPTNFFDMPFITIQDWILPTSRSDLVFHIQFSQPFYHLHDNKYLSTYNLMKSRQTKQFPNNFFDMPLITMVIKDQILPTSRSDLRMLVWSMWGCRTEDLVYVV